MIVYIRLSDGTELVGKQLDENETELVIEDPLEFTISREGPDGGAYMKAVNYTFITSILKLRKVFVLAHGVPNESTRALYTRLQEGPSDAPAEEDDILEEDEAEPQKPSPKRIVH